MRGHSENMTSMRPETVSSIAAGSFFNLIASTIPNLQASVTFYSNNEATVKNGQRTLIHEIGSVRENDIDVTIQNMRLIKNAHSNIH